MRQGRRCAVSPFLIRTAPVGAIFNLFSDAPEASRTGWCRKDMARGAADAWETAFLTLAGGVKKRYTVG